jgi:peptidoglycan/xylan/chitin deacetylase (PgdA/CDA1 family)
MSLISLTFDNGPDPEVTPQVLEVLARHDIRASFFPLGDKLRDRRHLAERAHAEGHWIGNHTFNHIVPLGLTVEAGVAVREIARSQALIADLAHARRFFRPFGGGGLLDGRLLNREALAHLQENGHTCVLWNAVPGDWAHPTGWVDRALAQCGALEHALLVVHDLPTGAMDRLETFVQRAKDQGMTFVQDFPRDCVPIECGRIVGEMASYVSTDRH